MPINSPRLINGNPIKAGAPSEVSFHPTVPAMQYVQAADVSFGASGVVIPHALPPSSMRFATPEANIMLNIPSVRSIYENKRNGSGV